MTATPPCQCGRKCDTVSKALKSRGDVRVLVVDDYRPLADAFAGMLVGYGYHVRAAYSSEEALRLAAELEPHALIADVIMSGRGGEELAAAVMARLPGCRVLLMSAGPSGAPSKGCQFKKVDKVDLLKETFLMLEECRAVEDLDDARQKAS